MPPDHIWLRFFVALMGVYGAGMLMIWLANDGPKVWRRVRDTVRDWMETN